MWKQIISKIILGCIEGLIFYVIYVKLLPWLINYALGAPMPQIETSRILLYLGFFISMSVISSIVKPHIGIIFDAILTLFSISIVLEIIGTGVYETTIDYNGVLMNVLFEFKLLAYVIILATIIIGITRIFDKLTSYK